MISGRSLLLCDRIAMTSRPRTRIPSRPRLKIMAASAIAISSDSSDESVGSPPSDPYVATVARWRSRVTARSPSPSDFPIAPITAPPGTRRRVAILIRPKEAIPLVHSSGLDAPDHAYSRSSTRDVSSSCALPSREITRCSEAFRHLVLCVLHYLTVYPGLHQSLHQEIIRAAYGLHLQFVDHLARDL
ncbi:hypothetical protein Tco_1539071 [Tanacetum coccineum]